ncbi:MAG: hypothetical protein ABSF32_01785 [Ignavibacteria bacterium]|jgi:hypothetical protein
MELESDTILWVSSVNEGLIKYDGHNFTSYRLNYNSSGPLSDYLGKNSQDLFYGMCIKKDKICLYSNEFCKRCRTVILEIIKDTIYNYDFDSIAGKPNYLYFQGIQIDNHSNIWFAMSSAMHQPDRVGYIKNHKVIFYQIPEKFKFSFLLKIFEVNDTKYLLFQNNGDQGDKIKYGLIIIDSENNCDEIHLFDSHNPVVFEFYKYQDKCFLLAENGLFFIIEKNKIKQEKIPIDNLGICFSLGYFDNYVYCTFFKKDLQFVRFNLTEKKIEELSAVFPGVLTNMIFYKNLLLGKSWHCYYSTFSDGRGWLTPIKGLF